MESELWFEIRLKKRKHICNFFFLISGQINLEIEIGGKILEFSVTPFHAAIIYKFQDKDTWTISELSSSLKCSTACIRKRINLWQNYGLLKEEAKDTFRLVEDTSKVASNSSSQAPVVLGADIDDMNIEHQNEPEKKEHEHATICNFVFGMLRSMPALTLDRIYSLLCLYAFHGPNERTLIEIRNILDAEVKANQLVYANGVYTLPPNQQTATATTTNSTSPVSANENMLVD